LKYQFFCRGEGVL